MDTPNRLMKKVYIAGPMTGIDYYNFPEFHRVARLLRGMGRAVINPAEKETKTGTDKPDLDKLPVAWGGTRNDITPGSIHKKDIVWVTECDAIVLLRGWERSKGARLEVAVAQACGLPIYEIHRAQFIPLPENMILSTNIQYDVKGYMDSGNSGTDKACS